MLISSSCPQQILPSPILHFGPQDGIQACKAKEVKVGPGADSWLEESEDA